MDGGKPRKEEPGSNPPYPPQGGVAALRPGGRGRGFGPKALVPKHTSRKSEVEIGVRLPLHHGRGGRNAVRRTGVPGVRAAPGKGTLSGTSYSVCLPLH